MSGAGVVRVAAIDCGTNSVRLLVADVDPAAGRLSDVDRRLEIVRLGQGVDATGRLGAEPLARTFRVLRSYRETIAEDPVIVLVIIIILAAGDARDLHGPGAAGDLPQQLVAAAQRIRRTRSRFALELVRELDAVHGSTEFVLGGPGAVTAAVSVNIGCVRMTERYLRHDPPGDGEIAAARADIDAALDVVAGKIPVTAARTLVGLAGSVTTVAALVLGLDSYQADRIHHSRISAAAVREVAASLLSQTRAERNRLAVMHPGRVDVIGGGALVLTQIMERFGFGEVLVSEHDILDGLAWSLATGAGR